MAYLRSQTPIEEVIHILLAGASVSLDAPQYTVDDLVRLAVTAASRPGITITLRNAGAFASFDLARIAQAGRGRVNIEF